MTREIPINQREIDTLVDQVRALADEVDTLSVKASFVEFNPSPVMRICRNGKIESLNPTAAQMFAPVSVGSPLTEIFPEFTPDQMAKLVDSDKVIIFSFPWKQRFYQFALRGSSTLGAAHLYGSDVTELKEVETRLRQTMAQMGIVLEASAVGLAHAKNGRFNWVNPRLEEIFGYEPEEMTDGPVDMIFPEWRAPAELAESDTRTILERGETFQWETTFHRKNKESFWGRVQIRAVDPKEAVRGFIVVFEDFTDRKKMEDALREEKERAEEATRLKDKFVTLVTHDLRSPLGTILAFLKMLKGTPNIAAERRDEILGRAIGSAESSLEMIENLLDINRLQSGKLQPTFSLFMAHFPVADAVALFTAAAAEKNITLEVSIPRSLHLFGDRALVAEVVKNIISNAIKFSHPGSAVKVHIPPDRPTTIAVEDSGAGIPAERMETLFRSDVKTSTPGTAGERGSGFGLPLCREIMEAHGGSLTVTSEVGKGSIFYAELPRRRPVALVIAPDQKILTTTSTLLASLDMQVHEAHSVATGAEYLAMQEPSVIVLQVSVTTHAAFDLIDQIKFHPLSHTVPILALAPNDCADCRDKAFAVGADDIADIPIRPDDLLPRIKRLLAKTVR